MKLKEEPVFQWRCKCGEVLLDTFFLRIEPSIRKSTRCLGEPAKKGYLLFHCEHFLSDYHREEV